jgi:Xaa-Pro aminopeptidase
VDTPSRTGFDLAAVQSAIEEAGLDAWLFYDFRGSDPIARKVLGLDSARVGTRRWFYCVPAQGQPQKLVHAIEPHALASLPGKQSSYLTWQSLALRLKEVLAGRRRVAMQYSPGNDVPYVSRVDAGTLEAVRSLGVEVVSSADLVQRFDATLSDEQLESHRYSMEALLHLVDEAFEKVAEILSHSKVPTERDVLHFMEGQLAAGGLVYDHAPIVAVNAHAADPHFEVPARGAAEIRPGDLLLIDVWAKEQRPGAVYADITWCGVVGGDVPDEVGEVFAIVRRARDAVIERADAAFRKGEEIRGFELDRVARELIAKAGYGQNFIHRTGHSIQEEGHGNGANLDDLETHDTRRLLPRTLFSVEPGIYLPGRFGVRSEVNVFHTGKGAEVTGGKRQEELVRISVR